MSYQKSGLNILCLECGFSFPVISARALNVFKAQVNKGYQGIILSCPHCGKSKGLTRHGRSKNGLQRIKCPDCSITFIHYCDFPISPRLLIIGELVRNGRSLKELPYGSEYSSTVLGRDLSKMASISRLIQTQSSSISIDSELSTAAFLINFNASSNRMYAIVTADKRSRRIIAISTNYAPSATSIPVDFQYKITDEESCIGQNLVSRIFAKDRLMSRRDVYFDTHYGTAQLKSNDSGAIVKPVLAAYRHFELVKTLTDRYSLYVHHYLEHECFIYGGCLVANLKSVQDGNCHISFVYEQGDRKCRKNVHSEMIVSDIVWNDAWYYYSQRQYHLAVCNLTGLRRGNSVFEATLEPAQSFIQFVQQHPFYMCLIRHSPANVNYLLEFLMQEYNQYFYNADTFLGNT
ncbi:cytoplasmic protein [Buttiauxella sp. B2]|uniref:IS1/IS1595 family N-terminal zinc-binding domain-containing protein n=1 Tax=Buttiauxella sp. B2 TaxID=2587812 RepID=UPI001CB9AA97|nr:cytoplasmic protein [Buttiauxella sp. B2]